jgi:hypothetical protein
LHDVALPAKKMKAANNFTAAVENAIVRSANVPAIVRNAIGIAALQQTVRIVISHFESEIAFLV